MMKNFKKWTMKAMFMFGLLIAGFAVVGIGNYSAAQGKNAEAPAKTLPIEKKFQGKTDNVFGSTEHLGTKDKNAIKILGAQTGKQTHSETLLNRIKGFINWVLGVLSLIALILLLWGGFQMVTAAGDEGKYGKGFTILKQAGIGLAFIGLSRLMVSLIFYVIDTAST